MRLSSEIQVNMAFYLLLAMAGIVVSTVVVKANWKHFTPEHRHKRQMQWFGIVSGILLWHSIWYNTHQDVYEKLFQMPIFWIAHVTLLWAYLMKDAAKENDLLKTIRRSAMGATAFGIFFVLKLILYVPTPHVSPSMEYAPQTRVEQPVETRERKPDCDVERELMVTNEGSDTIPYLRSCHATVHGDYPVEYDVITFDENRRENGRTHTGLDAPGNVAIYPHYIALKIFTPNPVRFTVTFKP